MCNVVFTTHSNYRPIDLSRVAREYLLAMNYCLNKIYFKKTASSESFQVFLPHLHITYWNIFFAGKSTSLEVLALQQVVMQFVQSQTFLILQQFDLDKNLYHCRYLA